MGRASRREREVRRLAAAGRAAYGTRYVPEEDLYVAAAVVSSGDEFLFSADYYRLAGAFGNSVREETELFPDADSALAHLEQATGIPVHELKT